MSAPDSADSAVSADSAAGAPPTIAACARERWRPEVLPLLTSYARIPNLSPAFDPAWEATGAMDEACRLLADWAATRPLPGAAVEVVRLPGLTPTLLVDVPATDPGATGIVLVYCHYDKQPPGGEWSAGRGPWTPTLEGDRLYARGVADDGYALPSALLALESVRATGGRHARCVVLAEGSEESGSPHLPAVLDHLAGRIGVPDVVVALDSGSPTYDRLWVTTSLRGVIGGLLTVTVLEQGVHSGAAGAVVPSSFRLARLLLDRVEDAGSGELLLPELRTTPPDAAVEDAAGLARALEEAGAPGLPFPVVAGLVPDGADRAERALRVAWSGALAVVGAAGLPDADSAGNVLRASTSLKLVVRVPPTCDAGAAADALARTLLADPPSKASVTWEPEAAAGGWAARPLSPWLARALDEASVATFGRPAGRFGEGGTIPFVGWLAERFTGADILAAGVLGPGANAHGPDESLHLPTAERVTGALALLLDAHARQGQSPDPSVASLAPVAPVASESQAP